MGHRKGEKRLWPPANAAKANRSSRGKGSNFFEGKRTYLVQKKTWGLEERREEKNLRENYDATKSPAKWGQRKTGREISRPTLNGTKTVRLGPGSRLRSQVDLIAGKRKKTTPRKISFPGKEERRKGTCRILLSSEKRGGGIGRKKKAGAVG